MTPDVTIALDELDELERGPIRTIIEDSSVSSITEVAPSEYHDKHVQPHLERRPWLDILDEFLDPTVKSPKRFAIELNDRLFGVDVQVIHLMQSGVNIVVECKNKKTFKEAINSEDNERIGTVVIAEGLTRELIDMLGMQYGLEPEFVACHLQGTQAYRMGHWESPFVRPTVRAPNILSDSRRKAPYYNVEFRRPYHIPEGPTKLLELRSTITNTPRGAQTVGGGVFAFGTIPDIFVFEKVSVYKRKGAKFGISNPVILTDKLLSREQPASYMLDIINLPDDESSASTNYSRRKQVSCREELVGWLEPLGPQEAKLLFEDNEPLALRQVLKTIERASSTFLAHARFIMSRIVTGHCDEKFPDSIGFFIKVLRSLHWEIHDQQKVLKQALRVTSLRGGEKFEVQIKDIEFLLEDMVDALKSLDEDVRFLVAAASIREGKVVGLISKFAFIFLPISLLAAILSINDDMGYIRFTILGSLSAPFILISTYLMFFWKASQTDNLSGALVK